METALPEFVAPYHALRAGAGVENAELLQTLEATLRAALFHGSLVSGHLMAATFAAASATPSSALQPDAEQPARKRPKTTVVQLANSAVVAPPSSSQAALYHLVCSRVQSGMLYACFSP